MLQNSTRRLLPVLRRSPAVVRSSYSTTNDNTVPANDPHPKDRNAPTAGTTNTLPASPRGRIDHSLQETPEAGEERRVMQAPNRAGIWSRSQQPREKAMVGPRFEQTIMADQPRPLAAIDLIHQQPVTWTHKRVVSCDGGGGPLGHPRIFINTDKPQIAVCTYCGLPFANEHHRKHLESLPSTTYPLAPAANSDAQIPTSHATGTTGATASLQSPTGAPYEQR